MKKIFVWAFVLICTINLSAQTQKTDAMLFGDVKDKQSQIHLPYATISVKGTNLITAAMLPAISNWRIYPLENKLLLPS